MRSIACAFILAVGTGSYADLAPAEVEFFESKIRPVLAHQCYDCHNSLTKQKGGLALDHRAAMLKGGDSGRVIVPGKPDESLLLRAVRHEVDAKMPAKAPKLTDSVLADLARWIEMGAPDPRVDPPTEAELKIELPWPQVRDERAKWWAFRPLVNHAPPRVDADEWSANAIDRFVYDRMKREGLQPQPIAEPAVLVRRLHLILTGLPPEPEVVEAFVADGSPDSYERLVDRLLASPAFGERWARHWMDWYRYAETHGSEGDPPIAHIQRYRDYLVRALNADVPYDRLLREHLAGDLLPDPRINRKLGFNESAIGPAHLRMVPHGFGVTDAYAEQIAFTDNQIDVISKAMLGVTVSCARCHDHKFDPISQKDFYRFYGVMVGSRPSSVLIDTPERLATSRDAIVELKQVFRQELAAFWLTRVDGLPQWLAANDKKIAGQKRFNEPLGAWNLLKGVGAADYTSGISQQLDAARQLEKANAESIANAELYLDLRDPNNADRWSTSGNSSADRVSPAGSFAMWPSGDRAVRGIYPRGIYTHLISDKHAAVFSSVDLGIAGKQGIIRVIGADAQLRFPIRNYPLTHGGLHPPSGVKRDGFAWMPGTRKWGYWRGDKGHFELRTSRDTIPRPGGKDRSWWAVTEIYVGSKPPEPIGVSLLTLIDKPETIKDRDTLASAYAMALRQAIDAWGRGAISDTQAELVDAFVRAGFLPNRIADLPESLRGQVARYRELEAAIPVPTRAPGVIDASPTDHPLLVRGEYKDEGDPVRRAFLEVFDSKPYPADRVGRLELANDIVSDRNTLKTRVLLNRLWAYVFGRGLVSSTDNLGRLGSEPTHPELLDHIALDFEGNGWSIKRALRQMVLSRTFRSSSQADEQARLRDPKNLYLSHYTPRRLDAEAIHDSVVRIGGRNDRAIYKPVIRNRLDPFLQAFNAPVPKSTVSYRNHTNVPAQALAMMNGAIVENAARAWSQRVERDAALATPEQKIEAMYLQAYARSPSAGELRLMLTYLTGKPEQDVTVTQWLDKRKKVTHDLARVRTTRRQLLAPVRAKLQQEVDRRNAAKEDAAARNPVDLKPIARWDFEGDARDSIGKLHGSIKGEAKIEEGALVLDGGFMRTEAAQRELAAKSLEVLVQLDSLQQRGGGAMSVQTLDGSLFDSIVFAEQEVERWLAGSDHFRRTDSYRGPAESEATRRPVRMIYVYGSDGTIRGYRDGKPYGREIRKSGLLTYRAKNWHVVFGLRHGTAPGGNRMLTGRILEARLYDRALTAEEAAAASSGLIKEVVTTKQLIAALSVDQRQRLHELDEAIADLEKTERDLSRRLEVEQQRGKIAGGGYFGIAHALLNSKEFIYVH